MTAKKLIKIHSLIIHPLLLVFVLCATARAGALEPRERILFNSQWRFQKGDPAEAGDRLNYFKNPAVREAFLASASEAGVSMEQTRLGEEIGFSRPSFDDRIWRKLDLPHDWAIEGPFDQNLPGQNGKLPCFGVGWYRKSFSLPASDSGRRISVEIDGAMAYAMVWFNGHFVGGWPYGYNSFRLELSKWAKPGQENVLAIRVENPEDSSRWYPGSGIYRNVWLTKTEPVHLAHWGTRVTADGVSQSSATLALRATVENDSAKKAVIKVRTDILLEGDRTGKPLMTLPVADLAIAPGERKSVKSSARIEQPKLWSTESPQLYCAVTTIEQDGKILDRYETPFGIRSIQFTANNGFHLNGKRLQLQGAANHKDLGALGAAWNTRAAQRQLEILKEMGCNALRPAAHMPSPELMELCDRMGIVVMGESFDCWKISKNGNDYSRLWDDWHEKDLRALISRDANHPCIIMWDIGNEVRELIDPIRGPQMTKELTAIANDVDPTRPTVLASNRGPALFNGMQKNVGVMGRNYGIGDYIRFRRGNPKIPLVASETVCVTSSRGEYFFQTEAMADEVYQKAVKKALAEGKEAPPKPPFSPVSEDVNQGRSDFQVSSYDLYGTPWAYTPDTQFATLKENSFVAGEFVWSGIDYLGEPCPYNRDVTIMLNFQDAAGQAEMQRQLNELGKITVPSRSSYFGMIDLAGFKKDRFYLYQAHWRPDFPMAHLLPHWNWPERIGKVTPVHLYTSGDEAELFLNGKSLGRKKKGPTDYRLRWDEVVYEPGEIKAVAYKNGKEWARDVVKTTGPATRLTLLPDRRQIANDGLDLSFVTVRVEDKEGLLVPRSKNLIRFEVSGPGEIVAVDNGDATSHAPFKASQVKAYNGLALVILRAQKGQTGEIQLTASSDGLAQSETRCSAVPQGQPGLIYHPEGNAIVLENGSRWYNRPLYCNTRQTVILAGEMPGLTGPLGTLQGAVKTSAGLVRLDEFSQRTMRYRPGRMEWDLADPRFTGLKLAMTATTVSEGDGFVVELKATGANPGDELLWRYFPPDVRKGTPAAVKETDGGFRAGEVEGVCGEKLLRTAPIAIAERTGGIPPSRAKDPPIQGTGLEWVVPLNGAGGVHYVAVTGAGVKKPVVAKKSFEDGLARVMDLGDRVKAETPDPWFDAGVGASTAAMAGLYVAPNFVHGGSDWRNPYLGWRIMDGATAYGWHDRVAIAMEAKGKYQLTSPNGKTEPEPDPSGARQSSNSCFFGLGKIVSLGDHYDMQTQFFDQCVRDWRSTGDREFAAKLLPMLELHLQWAKECFDPEDRGLYESYLNSWPTDNQWYNGGGTSEESAYIYYQRRGAADLYRQLGKPEEAKKHDAEADKIAKAVDRVLWLPGKGRYGAYIEQSGLKRVHDDAWVYSEHLPIEAGLATPMQAWQAMYYTDREMEKYKFPYGGEMRQTSNWVPGTWSVRELYHGDNFAMALGYFLAGQGDEGWEMIKGAMRESMYGDPTVKHGYWRVRPQIISPGGLSQPNCSIDFADITSMFCRAVTEGLFGYRPDYPNGVVTVAPSFPSAWDHASFRTPDYSILFKKDGDVDRYTVSLSRPARMQLRLPVSAERVVAVTVNGLQVGRPGPGRRGVEGTWTIEPWTGYGMLKLDLPATDKAEIVVELHGRVPPVQAITLEKKVGETKVIVSAIDPQGCLGPTAVPGHRLAFAKVERGNVPFLQVYKVEVTDPEGDAERAAKTLTKAPENAVWSPVAMTNLFNGDIREIFKQKYLSPRPNTVSCRLAYNGITPWIGAIFGATTNGYDWGKITPVVQLDKAAATDGAQEPFDTAQGSPARPTGESTGRAATPLAAAVPESTIMTPQQAVFERPREGKNIAFTSLWDNWPRKVTVPVGKKGEALWLLICGSTNPMQGRIANAVITFRYADGKEERLDLVPPWNFWSMLPFGIDYDYKKDGFALPKEPPPQVQLGKNCRAMVYGWTLRPEVELRDVTLETLSQEVVIGLMGVSVMNY
jgi:beta-galactosidase